MAAAARQLDAWLDEPDGALALMILLDQYPRNAYRGTAHMFATDPLALLFAERAIAAGHDLAVDPALRQFFYMPFEHAETVAAQNRAVALMEPLGADAVRWAVLHRDIIKRFGRFPIATPRWAGRPRSPSRSSWTPAASPADTRRRGWRHERIRMYRRMAS
ncbi:hypothetical protein BBAD15_g12558 [Beauveria bassiana D1-5]|uniref:DUF924 domain-containing protein n=1 Tax=Beauveria bassiana D1-5 TaxID=1245745 RepID=A0A0A2V7F1_BEABA|nr:hypothetical protein BBAD15_g12558 [Beauveria bassiana D1-5]